MAHKRRYGPQELHGSGFLHLYENFMNHNMGISRQHVTLHPIPGAYFDPPYFVDDYYDGSDYDDYDGDSSEEDKKKPYCGFNRRFLERGSNTRNRTPPREISEEEAERLAKELVDSEAKCKQQAEKKRLKKMRQKERKRLEKLRENKNPIDNSDKDSEEPSGLVDKINKPNDTKDDDDKPLAVDPVLQKSNGVSVSVKPNDIGSEESEEGSVTSELEELDLTSSFVSKAAAIAQRKKDVKPKAEKKENKVNQVQTKNKRQEVPQETVVVTCTEEAVKRSVALAVLGNQLASSGQFEGAVNYFTDAIKFNPKESRLFGNRSYCYEKMQQYEKSLADAEIALAMSPSWIRGLYRKGRALIGLRRYNLAVEAFSEILKLDCSETERADACQERLRVQILQLMEMGFSYEQSTKALAVYQTVEKAVEALSSMPGAPIVNASLPFASASQPEEEQWEVSGKKGHNSSKRSNTPVGSRPGTPVKSSLPTTFTTKPIPMKVQTELFPIWVGNLVPSLTEETIHRLFSIAGEIHNVKLLSERRCAFINYTSKESCERAIKELNGHSASGTILSVRYPDRVYAHLGVSRNAVAASNLPAELKSTGECFYWRNMGCIKRNCTYKHVPEHKGIDMHKGSTVPLTR